MSGIIDVGSKMAVNGWNAYAGWAHRTEGSFLSWLNPEVTNKVTRSWFCMPLEYTLIPLFFYLGFVLFAPFLVRAIYGAAENQSGKKRTVIEKIQAEPILFFQFWYNVAQVVLCGYMAVTAASVAWNEGFSWVCNPFDYDRLTLAPVVWLFFMSKILDFNDTVFIILRRKWRQLSFLHVYHHTSIYLLCWMTTAVVYDGDSWWSVMLNSLVHFVMYGYYALTTLNVPMGFLKRRITAFQMMQFFSMLIQSGYILVFHCPYPVRYVWIFFGYISSLVVLFQNFRVKNYFAHKKAMKAKRN